ncbi:polysaccharide deacetylase family protein [bacterium]|nr:polysaccharide deacetylase family protein [bacterium]
MRNCFSFLRERLSIRSESGITRRLYSIFQSYGWTTENFRRNLESLADLLEELEAPATFPVTASAVARHPALFGRLQKRNMEFAVHGYRHIDYSRLPREKSLALLTRSREVFRRYGLCDSGFRYPFLRKPALGAGLLESCGFLWDSSEVVSWPLQRPEALENKHWNDYLQILGTYDPEELKPGNCLPRLKGRMVEIPVSMPDDDILFERLKLPDRLIRAIWEQILTAACLQGVSLVIQFHPERWPLFKQLLRHLIRRAREGREAWICNLSQMSEWWRRRSFCTWKTEYRGAGLNRVVVNGPAGLALLGSMGMQPETVETSSRRDGLTVTCRTRLKPVIGVSPQSSESLFSFLGEEGWAWERTETPEGYPVVIRHPGALTPEDKRRLLSRIRALKAPLLKVQLWPAPHRYALAVSGDIDGIDFWDYMGRFYGS